MAKYKATGCSRFLFFLIIFIPIAYFGSQYLMESGKWEEIRSKVENVTEEKNSVEKAIEKKTESIDINSSDIERKLKQLLDKVDEQEKLINTQQEMIQKQSSLIDQLKQQLGQSNNTQTTTKPTTTTKSGDGNSLEDLLKEADKALKKN